MDERLALRGAVIAFTQLRTTIVARSSLSAAWSGRTAAGNDYGDAGVRIAVKKNGMPVFLRATTLQRRVLSNVLHALMFVPVVILYAVVPDNGAFLPVLLALALETCVAAAAGFIVRCGWTCVCRSAGKVITRNGAAAATR
jgi:hypothetical protein